MLNEIEGDLKGYIQGHLQDRSLVDIKKALQEVKIDLLRVGKELSESGEETDWQEKWKALMSSPVTFKLTTSDRDVQLERVPGPPEDKREA